VGRKVIRDQGECLNNFIREMRNLTDELNANPQENLNAIGRQLTFGLDALKDAGDWISTFSGNNPDMLGAGAKSFLTLFGNVTAGWLQAKSAILASEQLDHDNADTSFLGGKIQSARYFADQLLSGSGYLRDLVKFGSDSVVSIEESQF